MEKRCICGDGVWFFINKCPLCQMEKQCHTSDKYAVKSHCPVHYKPGYPPRIYYRRVCNACVNAKKPAEPQHCCDCQACLDSEWCDGTYCCNCKAYNKACAQVDAWANTV